ncbi:hypothetical protein QEZ54_35390 [Catellatospora sp. KI3]|uniref:hypothetical protein n=1 Tax=Catellatospora sp. KI3 TaxID=3041620 RepID=UPI0024824890|nr:hypothetical protein [Catellatospora sp. KI3]MDI1466275.1 hypothetical protein [Catellatospora sp. KI3]
MARTAAASADQLDPADQWTAGARTARDPLPVGVYEDGTPAHASPWTKVGGRNVFVTGAMGSGKTNLLNVLTAGLVACHDTVIFGADVAKSGKSLAPWITCFDWFATTPEEVLLMLRAMNRIIKARATEGARLAAQGKGDAVLQPSPRLPLLVGIFDELSSLLGRDSDVADACTEEMTQIAETDREVAVAMILSTQKPTQDSLGNSGRLKSQLNPVLAGRMNRLSDLRWALPNAPAESLNLGVYTTPGVWLSQDGADASPLPMRSFALYEPADVARLAAYYAPHRPQLDAVSRLAAGPDYANRNRDPFGIGADTTPTPAAPTEAAPAAPVAQRPAPDRRVTKADAVAASAQAKAAIEQVADLPDLPPVDLDNLTQLHPPAHEPVDPDAIAVVLTALQGAPDGLTRAEIQAATGRSKSWTCEILAAMTRDEQVSHTRDTGKGGQRRYRLTHPT